MLNFIRYSVKEIKKNIVEIRPDFQYISDPDIFIRGGSCVGIYNEKTHFWESDIFNYVRMIDRNTQAWVDQNVKQDDDSDYRIQYMRNNSSGVTKDFQQYCKNIDHTLETQNSYMDHRILFADEKPEKNDYATTRLPYYMVDGSCPGWDELVGTLYKPLEQYKLEWFIGALASNHARDIDKFCVIHGMSGTGKSTILKILRMIFQGYCQTIDMSDLASPSTNAFSGTSIASNPTVGIQDDGDLSVIKGNTLLNSICSHEEVKINEKFKSPYWIVPRTIMWMGTNYPVQITSESSGVYRRLVNVEAGNGGHMIDPVRYDELMNQIIPNELGMIVSKCIKTYNELGGKNAYDSYRAGDYNRMSNTTAAFLTDNFLYFQKNDPLPIKLAWQKFKEWSEDANVPVARRSKIDFTMRIRAYYDQFLQDTHIDGRRVYNVLRGFKTSLLRDYAVDYEGELVPFRNLPLSLQRKYHNESSSNEVQPLVLDKETSILDDILKDCPAQYGKGDGTPKRSWDKVVTKLSDLDTTKLHYVRVPETHIVIDFDLKNDDGEKDAARNLLEAAKWPDTYAEYSKSGAGVHLHYIYDGDPKLLDRIYSEGIEIKVYTGKSALRRRLTKCNDFPVAHLAGGYLPLRKEKDVSLDAKTVKDEKHLRRLIVKAMKEKTGGGTITAVQFIKKVCDEAREAGFVYDISDMRLAVEEFASYSTNHAKEAYKLALQIKWQSVVERENTDDGFEDGRLVFYDVEVFPNLFLINWKFQNDGSWGWDRTKHHWQFVGHKTSVNRMINPTPAEVADLFKYRLVGFNNRRYDNHMLYAWTMGYTNEELYDLSQRIINNHDRQNSGLFREAYNLSYTDVYDFASAGNKMSLKKFEIKLGLEHVELEFPWDEPVPEEEWSKVASYCDNDVISTEAVFAYLDGDFRAREMLATLTGMTVNDTTNQLSMAFIFGKDRHPKLTYTDLHDGTTTYQDGTVVKTEFPNAFPGYEYKNGHNLYHRKDGEVVDLGRGGYVRAHEGMYENALTKDVGGMHPHSLIAMKMFGEYTQRFADIVDARMCIKHKEFEKVSGMFDGALVPYLGDQSGAKAVAAALKTVVNSVYGLTSASFDNPCHDPRNVNNIVALRGALFMAMLEEEVEEKGYKVIHIKTDSIKIADPDNDILDYVEKRGREYGYTFETEAIWDRLCLVNKSVFIGHQTPDSPQHPGEWSAVGAQFQQPYVFKTLFSKEKTTIDDFCEFKEVKSPYALYIECGDEHRFIGRNGQFTPVHSDVAGSGRLVKPKRSGNGWDDVTGTKGYKWIESSTLKERPIPESCVDLKYYTELVNKAINTINRYGDFAAFVDISKDACDVPFVMPCGNEVMTSCVDCPHYVKKQKLCGLGFDIDE